MLGLGLGAYIRSASGLISFSASIFSKYRERVIAAGGVVENDACTIVFLNNIGEDTYNTASLIMYPSGYEAGTIFDLKPTDGTGDLTFTRASTATRVNSDGLIESVATGVPRIDYTGGGCGKLLLEPQRTNLFTYSSEFDNADWVKSNSTITANAATSPDGYVNADKLITNNAVGNGQVNQTLSKAATATTYTISAFAKKGEWNKVYLYIAEADAFSNRLQAFFNIETGTVIQSNAFGTFTAASGKIENYGNGWYRVSATVTTSNETEIRPRILATDSVASLGDGTSGIYIYGAQLEAGSYVSSYVPTLATAVTRVKDEMIVDDVYTNNLVTASGGTWYIEIDNNFVYTRDSSLVGIFIANDTSGGVSTDGLALRNNGAATRLIVNKRISGVQNSIYNTTTDHVKVVIKWNGTTADVFENGVKVVNATAFTPTIMEYFGSFGGDVPKYIVESLLFPTPLTDTQCIELTTI